jgi:hypothetical protein
MLLSKAVDETIGKLFEGLSHMHTEAREFMEHTAATSLQFGVHWCWRKDLTSVYNDFIFFSTDRMGLPQKPMTFSPDFIDDSAKGDRLRWFKKVLTLDGVTELKAVKDIEFPRAKGLYDIGYKPC